MANSPLVSVRIPPETLERVDKLAQKLYPPRRAGRPPNRSQVILDAIEQFLMQHESGFARLMNVDPNAVDSQIQFLVHHESEGTNTSGLDGQVNGQLDAQLHAEQHSQEVQQKLKYIEPSVREYIDWWFDYFSYLKKIRDVWFDTK
jgi:predicted DNA-binding protein